FLFNVLKQQFLIKVKIDMKHFSLVLLSLFFAFLSVNAQLSNPVKWSFDQQKNSANEYELKFTATIESDWHLYSTKETNGGPIPTTFHYETTDGFQFVGKIEASKQPVAVFDKTFNMELEYFSNTVTFTQKINTDSNSEIQIKGYVEYMSCNDESCTPPAETPFVFTLVGEAKTNTDIPENTVQQVNIPLNVIESSQPDNSVSNTADADRQVVLEPATNNNPAANDPVKKGMMVFLLVSFLAGLAAILTPCVFPMIPMTVSFFMRGSGNRSTAIKTALFFGFSIVSIYTLLGALFSVGVFGPNVGSILSTHWIPNTIFFVLFFVFALSFFGLFELVLPSSLANKADAKADKGGFLGAFFMALTTVIVSFSCTGPFIGYLIIEAVQGGGIQPLLGMFFFGLAFATPFTLLAIFPSALKKLPKSGGWLNSIKVVFAFILLAFGLKFLSNIDQVYGFNLLSRDVYLAIWISIFALLGFYFLGKIRFSHDSDVKHTSVGRLMLALITFSFTIYLFTGLLGAPLKTVSALLPPPSATKVTFNSAAVVASEPANALCNTPKYADKLHLPHGLNGYFDLAEGLACAKEQNKPAFVVFKGHACANCKKMENSVWANPDVLKLLQNEYVIIALYTDDRTSLPEDEWGVSAIDGRELKTMGRKNLDILMSDYNKNSIPYHVIITPDGKSYEMDVTYEDVVFQDFLRKAL
ncbi:MAG: thioredoxin family protein, partial [Prolixibacteraceae bacterium]|nr:thioredoxin family protein [Prolixibacteraceae bacterium]